MPIVLGRKPGGGGSGGGVTSIAESGQPALTGAVTLSEGSGVTLTQVGQDIEIASAGGGLLALQVYAPALLAVFSTTSDTLADVDATNAAVTFTAPASGNVIVRVGCYGDLTGADGEGFFGLREGASDISGTVTRVYRRNLSIDAQAYAQFPMYVSGISAGSHTYKLSFARLDGGTLRLICQDGTGTGVASKWGPLIMEVFAAP